MNDRLLAKPDLDEHRFRSSLDPLLYGVAHGLATLFPPIENARRPEPEDLNGQPREAENEQTED